MTTFFKAVRPDGGSFYDPGFKWSLEPGGVTKHPQFGGGWSAQNYLSVSTMATDCTGFRWPCRLLEVEPVGDVFTPEPELLPNKRAGTAFRTVRELPAHEVFGPNGLAVGAVIERAKTWTLLGTLLGTLPMLGSLPWTLLGTPPRLGSLLRTLFGPLFGPGLLPNSSATSSPPTNTKPS